MINMISILIFLHFPVARSEVWSTSRDWTDSEEQNYSTWINSSLRTNIFSSPDSIYFGIKTDCADAAMALRVLYAFEHSLPFRFQTSSGKWITNETDLFDNSSQGIPRIKELLSWIGESIGSEDLAELNTYSIRLEDIRAGDLYITRYRNQLGEVSRHVYIVKGFADNGDLVLISSTTPRAVRPLQMRIGIPSHFIDGAPFGFRRFFSGNSPTKKDFSLDQYEDMKRGENFYFAKIKRSHKKIEDTFELNIGHRLKNICMGLAARKEVLEYTQKFREKVNFRCLSRSEYEELSTVSRDHNIVFDIERLLFGYKSMVRDGKDSLLSKKLSSALNYISGGDFSPEAEKDLDDYCRIILDETRSMSVRSFYTRYKQGLISFDPNQSLEARWGLAPSVDQCKRF